ncbi:MAG: 4-hydroxy-tetrahydrodipicolinate reductase [bacterium]
MIRVLLLGIGGKMGQRVGERLIQEEAIALVAGIEAPQHPWVGKEYRGIPIYGDGEPYPPADAWVDFSLPSGAMSHIERAVQERVPMVIGVTGFSAEEVNRLRNAGEKIPLLWAPNFSLGAAVLERLAVVAGEMMRDYGDALIIEAHHKSKRDAPSGTALRLLKTLQEIGLNPSVHSLRGGGMVGEHTVRLTGEWEELELTHRVWSRQAFSPMVPRAIRFIVHQPPGFYTLFDLLSSS